MFSMSPDSSVALQGFNSYQNTYAFTVCLRAIFEMSSTRNIFSLSIGTSVALSLTTSPYATEIPPGYQLTLGQASKAFKMVSKVPSVSKLWPWTSLCVTWDSTTGMTQLWEDNSMSVRKSMWRGQGFYGTPVLSLSGFEGQVTDMHMWNQAMPVSVLRSYNQGWGYPQGTMLSWARTSYSVRGSPILEKAYESLGAAASEGKDESAEEQKKEVPVRRSWWWKQGKMGNVVQEGAENKYGCLGQRKRCGRKTL
ncbi:serum amyloid P-component-like [Engraulis encrasicolus]|uniref:serum amyloid P-component-like n=1 Tax=Engraulis encrasicolus TaxID=184585 RepID=UPI002FD15232